MARIRCELTMKRARDDDYTRLLQSVQAEALAVATKKPVPPGPGAGTRKHAEYALALKEYEASQQMDRESRALQLATEDDARNHARQEEAAVASLAKRGLLREAPAFSPSELLRHEPCAALASWLDSCEELAAASSEFFVTLARPSQGSPWGLHLVAAAQPSASYVLVAADVGVGESLVRFADTSAAASTLSRDSGASAMRRHSPLVQPAATSAPRASALTQAPATSSLSSTKESSAVRSHYRQKLEQHPKPEQEQEKQQENLPILLQSGDHIVAIGALELADAASVSPPDGREGGLSAAMRTLQCANEALAAAGTTVHLRVRRGSHLLPVASSLQAMAAAEAGAAASCDVAVKRKISGMTDAAAAALSSSVRTALQHLDKEVWEAYGSLDAYVAFHGAELAAAAAAAAAPAESSPLSTSATSATGGAATVPSSPAIKSTTTAAGRPAAAGGAVEAPSPADWATAVVNMYERPPWTAGVPLAPLRAALVDLLIAEKTAFKFRSWRGPAQKYMREVLAPRLATAVAAAAAEGGGAVSAASTEQSQAVCQPKIEETVGNRKEHPVVRVFVQLSDELKEAMYKRTEIAGAVPGTFGAGRFRRARTCSAAMSQTPHIDICPRPFSHFQCHRA